MPNDQQRQVEYLCIRDFDALQHYRDRALRWIKLYVDLLDDFEFQQLPDDSKFHIVGLMLLAARMGNRLPNNPSYLSRQIGANSPINIQLLLQSGFLVPAKLKRTKGRSASKLLAEPEQVASPEQTTTRQEQNRGEESDTTTDETARGALVVVGERKSKFTFDQVMQYVMYCKNSGQVIRSPGGLAATLLRTGEADNLIELFFHPEKSPQQQPKESAIERALARRSIVDTVLPERASADHDQDRGLTHG